MASRRETNLESLVDRRTDMKKSKIPIERTPYREEGPIVKEIIM